MRKCRLPPYGWVCTRELGHDGPCAAKPIEPESNKWFYICSAVVSCVAVICYTILRIYGVSP